MRTFGAFIDWCLRNMLRLVIIGAIVFVVFGLVAQTCSQSPEEIPAKVEDTNFMIKTDSRIFYVEDYKQDGPDIILRNFWVQEGGKWIFYERELKLNKAFGKVEVKER